jgi:hypothetical protein
VRLVEQHVIKPGDPRFAVIDQAAFAAKNLYNAALYLVRQSFIFEHRYLGYEDVYPQMKGHEAYRALPAKVAQQVLRLLDKNWQSYFAACDAYREDPTKFTKHPKLPHYKHKTDGRYALVYTIQALSRPDLRRGIIQPSMLPITLQTQQLPAQIAQVRIVRSPKLTVLFHTRSTRVWFLLPSGPGPGLRGQFHRRLATAASALLSTGV